MTAAPDRGAGKQLDKEKPRRGKTAGLKKSAISGQVHSAPAPEKPAPAWIKPRPSILLPARMRRQQISALLLHEHGGPCRTDDAVMWFEEIAVQMAISVRPDALEFVAGEWASRHTPDLPPEWIAQTLAEARSTRLFRSYTSKAIGERLRLTAAKKKALGITHIAACDVSPRQVEAEKLTADRERKRAKRLLEGRRPQAQSKTRLKPWEAAGISRATWYRRGSDASSQG